MPMGSQHPLVGLAMAIGTLCWLFALYQWTVGMFFGGGVANVYYAPAAIAVGFVCFGGGQLAADQQPRNDRSPTSPR